jgi:hypothetical protein
VTRAQAEQEAAALDDDYIVAVHPSRLRAGSFEVRCYAKADGNPLYALNLGDAAKLCRAGLVLRRY